MTIDEQMQSAVRHHRAGRLAEAQSIYRQVLLRDPTQADALHLLGLLAVAQGDIDAGLDLIRRAIAVRPAPEFLFNLGTLLAGQRRFSQAIESLDRLVQLRPDWPAASQHLSSAWANEGLTLMAQGRHVEALHAFQQATQANPDYADLQTNLGNALWEFGRLSGAITAHRRAIELQPTHAGAHFNLGIALMDSGDIAAAIAAYLRAIELKPNDATAYSNLGNVLRDKGDIAAAIAAYQRAIELKPDYVDAYNNLGIALQDQGRLEEAISAFRRAQEIAPESAQAYSNLRALKDQGRLDEAIESLRRAVALDPSSAGIHSNFVYDICFHPDFDGPKILKESQAWAAQHAAPAGNLIYPHSNDRSPHRKLKIGYVSSDFSNHPVGRFMTPIIERHDRSRFEVHCFSNIYRSDEKTKWFRDVADRWHEIRRTSDAAVADLIRREQIDILIDLGLHTGDNRLLVFARKPAPVQVTYLAYCGTSGMQAMDYLLSDAYLIWPGEEAFFTEKVIRLPHTYWCYRPMEFSTPINELPALAGHGVTFGCLNNFGKVTPSTLDVWSRVLMAVPGSRFLLHAKEGSHRKRVIEHLGRNGIDSSRLEFVGFLPLHDYIRQYHSIDIALDPFPFGGGTTTCDALWMGVPVISLVGKTAVSRGGLSILSNAGLPELVARSSDEYVYLASALAMDLPRLQQLRKTLRDRLRQSPLMDEKRFVLDLESAYRMMWRQWCESA